MQKMNNLQDKFLNQICRQKVVVTLFLTDRSHIRGVVTDFDESVVIFQDEDRNSDFDREQLVRKWVICRDAISAIELAAQKTEDITENYVLRGPEHHITDEKKENVNYQAGWFK